MFRRALQRGKLAHAFLLIGPKGIGKRTFARGIAQSLFCARHDDDELTACGECSPCRQVLAGTHPDLLIVGCPEGKRELPIDLIAGSAEKRGREGLCHDLSLRPMSATRRVAIIDDADTLNDVSANSLLKTIEEPPPGAILFLITPDLDPILATIRSRCQSIYFSALSVDEAAELLQSTGLITEPEEAVRIARLAEGSLETAERLIDPALRDFQALVEQKLAGLLRERTIESKPLIAAIEEAGDSGAQRVRAQWAVMFAVNYLRDQLSASTLEQGLPYLDQLTDLIDRTLTVEEQLSFFMPIPLCVEGWTSDLSRIARGEGR